MSQLRDPDDNDNQKSARKPAIRFSREHSHDFSSYERRSMKKIGFKITFQLFLWTAIAFFFVYVSYSNIVKFNQTRNMQTAVQQEIDNEDKLTKDLIEEQEYHESDAFVEKIARQQLGLVRPDERIFIKR